MAIIDGFLEAAKKGIVTVEFRKIDTNELRVMPCTLNPALSEGNVPEGGVEQRPSGDNYAVWSIDKKAWRSFRVNTVERWYTNDPEIQSA